MYEVDFLPVGDGERSGDAIALHFTRADTNGSAVVVIDAGFKDDGEALVEHIQSYYGTDHVDLAILTHPDGDHIGGMGEVLRGLDVDELWIHDLATHGGASLEASKAVNDLMSVAAAEGATVTHPWAGEQRFGGSLTMLGPNEDYYDQLVGEQVGIELTEGKADLSFSARAVQAAKALVDRIAGALPVEVPLLEQSTSPRNNTSMVNLLRVGNQTMLFTADAGVPALNLAWDKAEELSLATPPDLVQIPHHGSRRNASSAWLDRLLGPTGQEQCRAAFISCVSKNEKHPSGRVVNAHIRRGCEVVATAGSNKAQLSDDASPRGWFRAIPIGPMEEEPE